MKDLKPSRFYFIQAFAAEIVHRKALDDYLTAGFQVIGDTVIINPPPQEKDIPDAVHSDKRK